jgi:hypothetical protein
VLKVVAQLGKKSMIRFLRAGAMNHSENKGTDFRTILIMGMHMHRDQRIERARRQTAVGQNFIYHVRICSGKRGHELPETEETRNPE